MDVSRSVFDVEGAVRKLNSRFRRRPRISRPGWPVISATQPLFYLLRLFGLAPFEISENYLISTSYDVIYSILCALVHTYAIYIVLYKPALKRDTVLLDIVEFAKIIFNYGIVIFNIFMAVYSRRKLIGVLNIVKNFDSRMSELGHPRNERNTKVWVWGTCACTAFVWTMVSRSGMIAFNEIWIENVLYLIGYLAMSLSTIKFSSIVLLLGQRFQQLNNVAQLSKEPAMTNRLNCMAIDLKVIQQLHSSLMTAGESLSSQYAWQLLLWLTNLCVHSVSNIYFLIDWVLITPVWAKTQWALINCMTWWLVTYLSQLMLLHIACHYTSSEANSIGPIVINWKPLTARQNYAVESSLHLINRKLNFSAAGCFHVNLPLLRSITALLTTYLVLLKQFQ